MKYVYLVFYKKERSFFGDLEVYSRKPILNLDKMQSYFFGKIIILFFELLRIEEDNN
jgi:hypothetical protein